MTQLVDDMHSNVTDVKMENSLDLDTLEGNGQLGDMHWLHNSSFSALAQLDNEESIDSSNLVTVNPQSIIPMKIVTPHNKPRSENLMSSESANSAAMRLTANCSSLLASPEESPNQSPQVSTAQNVINQEHQTIRILQVASVSSNHNSPVKTQNILISSNPQDSPLKSTTQTFVLSAANAAAFSGLQPGLTITTNNSLGQSATIGQPGQQFVLSSPQKFHAITTDKTGRVLLKSGNNLMSPSQASPVLLGRLQTGVQAQLFQQSSAGQSDTATVSSTTNCEERAYPKPVFSYSCLIALALKNSKNGSLPVSEIYNFMCENFPYFKTAPDGWKNSVRHNLSLNKCFAKVDNPKLSQGAKKGCLWALNPAKIAKMEDEISKWGKKDPAGLLSSMQYPENLEAIEKGQAGLHYSKKKIEQPSPCTPLKAEATPVKREFSPSIINQDINRVSPIMNVDNFTSKMDRYQNHQVTHKSDSSNVKFHFTPVKQEYTHSFIKQEAHSPMLIRPQYSSPKTVTPMKSHTPVKVDNIDYHSHNHLPINNDALTDIVLQNPVWDEDLENNIDLDLICDSPSSNSNHGFQQLLMTQSPLTIRASPNPSTVQSHFSSGSSKPS